ncbi:MAG: GatB/YqeY domain-containing protein [Candidatus Paceibacterota bacterium]
MLKQDIQKAMTDSLKSGDATKRLVLGMLMTSIKNRELSKRGQLSKTVNDPVELEKQSQLSDEEVLEALSGEVKKRKESIEQYMSGGREELAEKEKVEMAILMEYMPEQMDEEAVRAEVQKTVAELGAQGPKDMGKVIGAVMAKLKGKAPGDLVSKIAKELLQI